MGYITEDQIRKQIHDSLLTRVRKEDEDAEEAKQKGTEFKRRFSMALLDTPEYKRWIDQRIEDHRKRGLLVTSQQLTDIRYNRPLKEGDRAKFVGTTRIENTRDGRSYTRQYGETGKITQAVRGPDGNHVYLFMPDYPKEALEEGGPDVFVAQLQFKEKTPGYFSIERIPEQN
jgi:hypothetical protein